MHDAFCKSCVEWENEAVILTLKNGKAYTGLLWKYPENPQLNYENQTISIMPYRSGHRDKETKKVRWNTIYPEYEAGSPPIEMEMIIPRSQIITFGKFSEQAYKYFQKKDKGAGS